MTVLAQLSPTASAAVPAAHRSQIQAISTLQSEPIKLHHVKTKQDYTLNLFDEQGTMRPQALLELRQFLACTKSGQDHPIHWRLATILHAVAAHWPNRTLSIVSGYRHPRHSHHSKRSNHTRGRAIDFRVQGVDNRELRDSLRRSFRGIGVGYYPNSSFVHLDIRAYDGQWIDYAGPGQQACYSPNTRLDLHTGLVENLSYHQAKQRGCKGVSRGKKSNSEHAGTRDSASPANNPAQSFSPAADAR